MKLILDLCAGTEAWSLPYHKAGYDVECIDLPTDVRLRRFCGKQVHGILAAPPCTCFSYARNRYPPTAEEFREALSVVDACLRIITVCGPAWWALENPVNKLRWFLGPPQLIFRQWEYGDDAEKPTGIWGQFNVPEKTPGMRTRPSTFKTSTENAIPTDGITPAGFARAFFKANP